MHAAVALLCLCSFARAWLLQVIAFAVANCSSDPARHDRESLRQAPPPADMTELSHGSGSNSLPCSPVYTRGSIRNYDDLDSLVAQTRLVASLVVSVDCSGGQT